MQQFICLPKKHLTNSGMSYPPDEGGGFKVKLIPPTMEGSAGGECSDLAAAINQSLAAAQRGRNININLLFNKNFIFHSI